MSDSDKPIGLMVRLPPDLHEQVRRFAAGSQKRPRASLNETIVFLLRAGLAAIERSEKAENEPGQWEPEPLEVLQLT